MSYATHANIDDQLIRKSLSGILLVAPIATPVLTTISGTGGALTIPPAYESLGKLARDGAERNREQEVSDILGWGDTSPARRDIETETRSLNITAIETKKKVIELFENVNLTGVTSSANHEVTWDAPTLPVLTDHRALFISRDINKANGLDIYWGLHFPRVNFTVNGGQTLAAGENPINYAMTLTALTPTDAPTPVRTFWAGPGMAGLKAPMGFPAAP